METLATKYSKDYDLGLRQFMLNMYNPLFAGLAVSGICMVSIFQQACYSQWVVCYGYLPLHL